MTLTEEISKRRTFAIISHPDAGKTTLTENALKPEHSNIFQNFNTVE